MGYLSLVSTIMPRIAGAAGYYVLNPTWSSSVRYRRFANRHRHWSAWCSSIMLPGGVAYEQLLRLGPAAVIQDYLRISCVCGRHGLPSALADLGTQHSTWLALSVWCSLLYVVVEGEGILRHL
jgi:hypothetical protein